MTNSKPLRARNKDEIVRRLLGVLQSPILLTHFYSIIAGELDRKAKPAHEIVKIIYDAIDEYTRLQALSKKDTRFLQKRVEAWAVSLGDDALEKRTLRDAAKTQARQRLS